MPIVDFEHLSFQKPISFGHTLLKITRPAVVSIVRRSATPCGRPVVPKSGLRKRMRLWYEMQPSAMPNSTSPMSLKSGRCSSDMSVLPAIFPASLSCCEGTVRK